MGNIVNTSITLHKNIASADDVLSSSSIIIDNEELYGSLNTFLLNDIQYDENIDIDNSYVSGNFKLKTIEETTSSTITSDDMVIGKTMWSNGKLITGTGIFEVKDSNSINCNYVLNSDNFPSNNDQGSTLSVGSLKVETTAPYISIKQRFPLTIYIDESLLPEDSIAPGYSINNIKGKNPYTVTTTANPADVLKGIKYLSYNATTGTVELKEGTMEVSGTLYY